MRQWFSIVYCPPPKSRSYAASEFYSLKRKTLNIEPRICPSGRFWCLDWRLLADSVPKCCHQAANHTFNAPVLLWLLRCIPSIHPPSKYSLWKPEQTSSFGVMTWVKTDTSSIRKHLSLFATPSARYPTSIVTILKGRDLLWGAGRMTLKCLYITAFRSQGISLAACVCSFPILNWCPALSLYFFVFVCFWMRTCPVSCVSPSSLVYCLEKHSLSGTNASVRILW